MAYTSILNKDFLDFGMLGHSHGAASPARQGSHSLTLHAPDAPAQTQSQPAGIPFVFNPLTGVEGTPAPHGPDPFATHDFQGSFNLLTNWLQPGYGALIDPVAFAAGAGAAVVKVVSASTVSVTSGGMTFDLIYDAAALAAPVAFRTGIAEAASILASYITDKITVNLNIDYSGTGGGAAAGPDAGYYQSVSQVVSLLKGSAAAGDTTFNALPSTSSIQGQSSIAVWNAQMKSLGLMAANDTTTDDGSAYFSTDINPNLLVGVALHELTHALGRVPFGSAPDIFDLFRFTSPGNMLFAGGATAPAAYFSLDGGKTKIADFGQNSDPSDFLNSGVQGPNDPFNEYYTSSTSQTLSTVDLELIRALGFHTLSSSPTPAPSLADLTVGSLSATGTTISFSLNNVGAGAAGTSTTGLYLTTHAVPTTSDLLVGSFSAAALAAGTSQAESIALTLPSNLAAGTYHLAAIADTGKTVSESNETNNVSSTLTVIVGSASGNSLSGTGAIMFGLAGNDTIKSLGGNSILVGGTGNDSLTSGSGNDQFVYNTQKDGLDQIYNFHLGDHFDFAAAGFGTALAAGGARLGTLDASHFIANATGPTTVAQEFWFNTSNHTLYFDALGSTHGSTEIALAHLNNTYVLHNTDILIV